MKTFLLLILFFSAFVVIVGSTRTALTDYVWREDPAYKWEFVPSATLRFTNHTVYNIFLTSQTWLTPSDSSAYLWTHWIQLCVPDDIYSNADTANLWIDGGRTANINNPPGSFDEIVARMCTRSRLMTAYLSAVPNSPVVFADDPSQMSRTEDAIIAWTWLHYVQDTMEPDWLARMPMTKASIKAMDAIQEFVEQELKDYTVPKQFITSGASKRGWTAWMTGCVNDPRVVGTLPVVAPIPNLVPQMNEQWQSLGSYSWALVDYVDVGLMPGYLNTDVFKELLHLIDPLTYAEEMAKTPKLIIVAWCDEFFQPDSAQYYWSELQGKKYLRVVPNADHPLIGSQNNVIDASIPFILSFLDQTIELPEYSWTIDGNRITVTASSANLVEAKAWYSRASYRDWRLVRCPQASCANPQAFASSVSLTANATTDNSLIFIHDQDYPSGRPYKFAAHLIELTYNLGTAANPQLFKITSDLSIISETPDVPFPYPPCPADICDCGPDCEPIDLILV